MNTYKEQEIKVLDVSVEKLAEKLEKIGAKKVYDDERTIMTFDTPERLFLNQKDKLIRL